MDMLSTINDFSDFFDAVINDVFGTAEMTKAWNSTAPKMRREVCTTSFPPSSYSVDDKTKSLHITVALAGLNEKDVSLDYENDHLKLSINKQEDKKDTDQVDYYRGLKLIKEGEVEWRVDRGKFDIDHADITFVDGLLDIVIPPTEAAKPKQKKLFGSYNPKALKEPENKNTSENKKEE